MDFRDPTGLALMGSATPELLEQMMQTRELVGLSTTVMRAAQSAAEGVAHALEGSTGGTTINWKATGNWQNKKIADHYVDGPLYVRGQPAAGETVGKVTAYGNPDKSVTAEVNVNWYVDRKFAGTNVVTRELEHVQGWRDWMAGMKNLTFMTFMNRTYPSTDHAVAAVRQYLTPSVNHFSETQYWRYDRSGGPHDLKYFPAQPVTLPEYDYTH
jgi:hypothetical protein